MLYGNDRWGYGFNKVTYLQISKKNDMAKQAIKKGAGIKKKGLASWKQSTGMDAENAKTVSSVSNANKPQEWFIMPKAFQNGLHIPGLPMDTVISVIGHSNSGKSTLVNHAIVAAQRQGYIPVIIDTENSFSFQYAMAMGFEAEPVYGKVEVEEVDPETGEITTRKEEQVVHWEGNFVYYNNRLLCERFGDNNYAKGTKEKTKRKIAVIEDVAMAINELLDAQDSGEIDQGFLFVWDSVGSIGCYKEYANGKLGNPMWTAAAMGPAFNMIVNDRIPSSRKVSSPYNNTFLYVNRVWLDNTTNPVGPPSLQTRGGKTLKWSVRMEILMGGQLTAGIKRLTATAKGLNYSYGIETKIKVLKNHLDAPHNVCYEGKLVASDIGFIDIEDLEDYKKNHISVILKQLNEAGNGAVSVTEGDVQFVEEDAGDSE